MSDMSVIKNRIAKTPFLARKQVITQAKLLPQLPASPDDHLNDLFTIFWLGIFICELNLSRFSDL